MSDKAKEYLEEQKFSYDSFTKLTSTGIEPDYNEIAIFAENYHQHRLKEVTEEDIIDLMNDTIGINKGADYKPCNSKDVIECMQALKNKLIND